MPAPPNITVRGSWKLVAARELQYLRRVAAAWVHEATMTVQNRRPFRLGFRSLSCIPWPVTQFAPARWPTTLILNAKWQLKRRSSGRFAGRIADAHRSVIG